MLSDFTSSVPHQKVKNVLARLTVALVLLGGFWNAGCSSERDQQHAPAIQFTNLEAEYVGDVACFDCHQDQWQGFQEHGMAQSFYPLTRDNAVEDYDMPPVYHAGSGYYYDVVARGDSFYQVEYRMDDRGARTHELVRRMDYVVGSGNAARTYLAHSEGRLYEMPLTWYAQGERWDLSPGYQLYNKRFSRLVPDRCMACHNSYPGTVPYVTGKYTDLPEGIGCERCHGPGSIHVEERLLSPQVAGAADPTIVNPAHLSAERQMDVCQQCHLHTTVSLVRAGREAFDFRPSQRLEDFVSLFSAPEDDDSGTIDVISHAQRLKQSICFTASSMTCTTCHNPHEGFREKGPAYFDDTCISCHSAPSTEVHADGQSCISCHMPKVPADGAPHSSFTDHWIRITGAGMPDFSPAHEVGAGTLVPYFPRDAEGADGDYYAALAYLVHGTQQADTTLLSEGILRAKRALSQDTTGELHFLLGTTLTNRGRATEALPYLRYGVEQRPVPERLNGLAQALEQAGDSLNEVHTLYERALTLQPAQADIRINYGLFLLGQGDTQGALDQFRQAAQEKPWLALAHTHLGTASIRDGDFVQAEVSLKESIVLEPDGVEALGALALLYTTMPDRAQDAQRFFERAAAVAPEDAAAQANLGAWYLNTGSEHRAVEYFLRATRLEPQFVDALTSLALAYARTGNAVEARRTLQRVLELDANNPVAQQMLDALQ